jgi:uncharacterized protein (TIGR00369 family)
MTEQEGPGSVRSRTTTWEDPAVAAAARSGMSGRQYVEGLAGGQVPPPPMASLFGFVVTQVGEGEVQVACRPEEAYYNPLGIVHGGLLCTLLDTAMGLSLQTLMPSGASFSTIEIKVNFLKAVRAGDGELTGHGRVIKRGSRVSFTEAEVRDPGGSLVGTATSSLLVHDPSLAAR